MNSKYRKANGQESLDIIFMPCCFPSSLETAQITAQTVTRSSSNASYEMKIWLNLAVPWRPRSANIQFSKLWQYSILTCAAMLLIYIFFSIPSHSKGNLVTKLIYCLHDFSCGNWCVLNTKFTLSFQMLHHQLPPFTLYMKMNVQSKNIWFAATIYSLLVKSKGRS